MRGAGDLPAPFFSLPQGKLYVAAIQQAREKLRLDTPGAKALNL
jgi:hypothetical protein